MKIDGRKLFSRLLYIVLLGLAIACVIHASAKGVDGQEILRRAKRIDLEREDKEPNLEELDQAANDNVDGAQDQPIKQPLEEAAAATSNAWTDFWVIRLSLNLAGYASIIIPAALVVKYVKNNKILDRGGHGCWHNSLQVCILGFEEEKGSLEEGGMSTSAQSVSPPRWSRSMVLLVCVVGLQASYLTWGLLQERIMSREYGRDLATGIPGERFQNSQFLVFMNRILAFATAGVILLLKRQPSHTAPMYKYSYSSLSNILSSWCQYEALKFVSFPTQVLAKASKVIPVMLMGKLVSGKSYEYYEYLTALLISVGVSMFLLSQAKEGQHPTAVTTFSGVVILVGYMTFDSFTSNWQDELFSRYRMTSFQMMFGVNLFSCIFTSGSLLQQGGFMEALTFMTRHGLFTFHVLLLSLCSATGQLFIFYTISQFGAVVFTIIMVTRQALAILLSCLIYGHPVTAIGVCGVLVVFAALFLRIYGRSKVNAHKKAKQQAQAPNGKS